jgi:hypothetical protein
MNIISPIKISKEDRDQFVQFALNNYLNEDVFTVNGEGRSFCNILNAPEISEFAKDFRVKVFNEIGIHSFIEEPMFGIFIGVNTLGGNVHQHKDSTMKGYYHFRLNFMLSKPTAGGNPVINNIEYEVPEGSSWVNLASEWNHSSTVVSGDKHRIVLSVGGTVKKDILDPLLDTLDIGKY